MIISGGRTTLKEAFKEHRSAIKDLLAVSTTEKAAMKLEKDGWPRE
jgi:hypothetical protein|tara:strand:- start:3686 stop:3823 length:138 start_codon:yes stop_codon:yes gene_type:complete